MRALDQIHTIGKAPQNACGLGAFLLHRQGDEGLAPATHGQVVEGDGNLAGQGFETLLPLAGGVVTVIATCGLRRRVVAIWVGRVRVLCWAGPEVFLELLIFVKSVKCHVVEVCKVCV